jgi:tRNA A37 threonylcarbamoyladenosine dehydratase
LRKLGVKNHKVVYFKNKAISTAQNNVIGSISYYPAISGTMLAAQVINDILNN